MNKFSSLFGLIDKSSKISFLLFYLFKIKSKTLKR